MTNQQKEMERARPRALQLTRRKDGFGQNRMPAPFRTLQRPVTAALRTEPEGTEKRHRHFLR
jgi:hypothetical protein